MKNPLGDYRNGLAWVAFAWTVFQFSDSSLGQQYGMRPDVQANTPIYFQPGSTAAETTSGTNRTSQNQVRQNISDGLIRYSTQRTDRTPGMSSAVPNNAPIAFGSGADSSTAAARPSQTTSPITGSAPFSPGQPFVPVSNQRVLESNQTPTALTAPSTSESTTLAAEAFPAGELVAIVGEEPILAADLFSVVDPMLIEAKEKLPETKFLELREKYLRQALAKLAQTKMLAQYFVGEQLTGKSLEERKAAHQQIDKRMTSAFHEMMLPRMLAQQKVDTPVELDRVLRDEGSSLAMQLNTFKDSMMAQEALKKHIPKSFEINAIEMRDRYEEKIADWKRPAKAKFRILTAQFSKTGNRDEAWKMIVEMGNEALTGGNFEAVARQKSHGSHAVDGGRYDWTAKGSLKSTQIDEVVFEIPLRRLSQIFEDDDGFHIVEVLDRESERTVPFEDAQDEIRESLIEFRKQQAQEKLMEKLQERTVIWSKWPNDIPNAKPLKDYFGTTGQSVDEPSGP
ncbi:MAG: peptidylprolyl isomerase [Planctomycetota bacterium]|nr:peptidylprolyl isomerase [Planctomycetota bacterium]